MRADDFLRQLESDPEWVARRDERERDHALNVAKHRAKLEADEMVMINEIRAAGYDVKSVWDLVNNTPHPFLERNFVGEYPNAYPILIKHLEKDHIREIREGIIRALTVPDGGNEVAWALLKQFETERDRELKWVIANALRTVMNRSARKKFPEIDACYKNPDSDNAG